MLRLTILLLAFGIVLQGCTLQKRSLMPGWHLEKPGQASGTSGSHIAEPVAEILIEESLQKVASAPSFVAPIIPEKALMAFSSQVDNTPELKLPRYVRRVNWHETQPIDEVVPSAGVKPNPQPSNIEKGKQHRIALSALAALLCTGSVFAFKTALRPGGDESASLFGVGLVAVAWKVLRVAFPRRRKQMSTPNETKLHAEAGSTVQPTGQIKGPVMRIALGLLAAVLSWGSAVAFILAGFDRKINVGLLLLGVGLLALALRAFSVTFPRLRTVFKKQKKSDAPSTEKREEGPVRHLNRDWLWLLAFIPVAFIIAVISTFSFPAFGM